MQEKFDINSNKKILFWIDVDSLFLFIAHVFQNKTNSQLYSIYDVPDKTQNFFKNQNLVDFKKSWFFHEHIQKNKQKPDLEYLSNVEEKYGINLWKLAINERFFYRFNRFYKFSADEILSILEDECKLFEKIFDEIDPDYIIMYDPPVHHSKLLVDLAKIRGIETFSVHATRMGSTSIVDSDHMCNFDKLYETSKGSITDFNTLQKKWKSANYSIVVKNIIETREDDGLLEQLSTLKDFLSESSSTNKDTHYTYYGRSKSTVIKDTMNFKIKKKSRKNFIDKNLEKNPDLNTKFIYFSLSDEEEMSVLHYTPFYTNQIETVRHVAKSIPIGYKLYVKEHPGRGVRGWRTIEDYQSLIDIPNVVLIHPSVEPLDIYENCSLVVSLRGTSGLDAAFYGKPSIVFGEILYSVLPFVYKVENLTNLPQLINTALKTNVNPIDVDRFFNLVTEKSIEFSELNYLSLLHAEFFHGGKLVDMSISEEKMKSFFQKNSEFITVIADEFIKKCNL
tara:strand:+ start:364 stop:1881 length:1518 start_codon:yes stop_codon:yes gene_type:complete